MYFAFSLILATLGVVLPISFFVLAAVFPVAGGYATYADLPSIGSMMRSMHSRGNS